MKNEVSTHRSPEPKHSRKTPFLGLLSMAIFVNSITAGCSLNQESQLPLLPQSTLTPVGGEMYYEEPLALISDVTWDVAQGIVVLSADSENTALFTRQGIRIEDQDAVIGVVDYSCGDQTKSKTNLFQSLCDVKAVFNGFNINDTIKRQIEKTRVFFVGVQNLATTCGEASGCYLKQNAHNPEPAILIAPEAHYNLDQIKQTEAHELGHAIIEKGLPHEAVMVGPSCVIAEGNDIRVYEATDLAPEDKLITDRVIDLDADKAHIARSSQELPQMNPIQTSVEPTYDEYLSEQLATVFGYGVATSLGVKDAVPYYYVRSQGDAPDPLGGVFSSTVVQFGDPLKLNWFAGGIAKGMKEVFSVISLAASDLNINDPELGLHILMLASDSTENDRGRDQGIQPPHWGMAFPISPTEICADYEATGLKP